MDDWSFSKFIACRVCSYVGYNAPIARVDVTCQGLASIFEISLIT
jgi:hypothetical protein